MKLFIPKIKKNSYIFLKNFFLIFREVERSSSKPEKTKKLLCFASITHILGYELALKRAGGQFDPPVIFQKMYLLKRR